MDKVFIERLWRSVKYENVYLKAYETGSALRQGLDEYFESYNAERTHQALDYRRPDDVYYDRPPCVKLSVASSFPLLAEGERG